MRYAVINEKDGLVLNVIAREEDSNWKPPEGSYLLASEIASSGDIWNVQSLIKTQLEPSEPTKSIPEEIAGIKERLLKLESAEP